MQSMALLFMSILLYQIVIYFQIKFEKNPAVAEQPI